MKPRTHYRAHACLTIYEGHVVTCGKTCFADLRNMCSFKASKYFKTLNKECKERYLSKISITGGVL